MRVYGLEGGPLRRSGRKLADLPSATKPMVIRSLIYYGQVWQGASFEGKKRGKGRACASLGKARRGRARASHSQKPTPCPYRLSSPT